MLITGLYAALCALLLLFVSARVSLRRREVQVGIGRGEDEELARRLRVQGNFVEYVPLALLLLLMLELAHTATWLLHVFGAVLVVARVAHAVGLGATAGKSPGRFFGTLGTWLVMLAMALLLFWQFGVLLLTTHAG